MLRAGGAGVVGGGGGGGGCSKDVRPPQQGQNSVRRGTAGQGPDKFIELLNARSAKCVALALVLGCLAYHGLLHLLYGMISIHPSIIRKIKINWWIVEQVRILALGFSLRDDIKAITNGSLTGACSTDIPRRNSI